jgi:hypothetical protein
VLAPTYHPLGRGHRTPPLKVGFAANRDSRRLRAVIVSIVMQSAQSIPPGIRERGQVKLHNSTDLSARRETEAGIDSPSLKRG